MATDFNKMKVVELKSELKRLGLPQNGLKAELVARLEAAASESDVAPGAEDETIPAAGDEDVGSPKDEEPSVEPEAEPEAVVATESSPMEAQTADAPVGEPSPNATVPIAADSTLPITTTDLAALNLQPQALLPPSPSNGTPLKPTEIIQDSQKRKRRSLSPPPTAGDIAQKRAKVDNNESEAKLESLDVYNDNNKDEGSEEVRGTAQEAADVEMDNTEVALPAETNTNQEIAPEAFQQISAQDESSNGHQTDDIMQQDPKQPSHSYEDTPMAETEHDVEPSIHSATSALYIKNFMRPLRPQAVQDHLVGLATPPGLNIDDEVIVNFYLDTIRTHSFVVFNSISAASRVRTALHNRIWPDETNRKALWVDFIPPESFNDWVDMEQSSSGGRGSANRYEVVYVDDRDGNVTARLEESGGALPAAKPPPPSLPERKLSIPTGPSRGLTGIEGAPLGPRGFQGGGRLPAQPSRPEIAGDYKTTTTLPAIAYKPVADELVDRRLASIRAAKSKDYDRASDTKKEYKRYFFERGDLLVDRGPEIFLGIRPPHRERERRRDHDRGGERPRGGRRGRRGPRGDASMSMPMPHGVPRGGDRYRGAAADYDDGPRYGDTRGGDRYGRNSHGRY